MKVSNNKDQVELSQAGRTHRARKGESAGAADKAKGMDAPDPVLPKLGAGTSVELSSDAKLLSRGIDAAKGAEISDKDRIAAIKAKIKAGTYEPDYGEVADKMVNESLLNG